MGDKWAWYHVVSGRDSGNLSDSGDVIAAVTGKSLDLKKVVLMATAAMSFTITDTGGVALSGATPVVYLPAGGTITLEFEPGQCRTASAGVGIEIDASTADNASVYMEAGYL